MIKVDKFVIPRKKGLDRRIKLTEKEREEIKHLRTLGLSTYKLAANFGVSRRLIQFILDPTKRERCAEQYKENQKNGAYYKKERHTKYVQKCREHKKELLEKNLLIKKENQNGL